MEVLSASIEHLERLSVLFNQYRIFYNQASDLEVFLVRQCEIFLDILSLHPANAIAASVAIAQKLGKLTLVDWVQADETTVNRHLRRVLGI